MSKNKQRITTLEIAQEKEKALANNQIDVDSEEFASDIVSSTESCGVIPTAPLTTLDAESYINLSKFPIEKQDFPSQHDDEYAIFEDDIIEKMEFNNKNEKYEE